MTRIRPVYAIAAAGVALAVVTAYLLSEQGSAQPPLFAPASNPYANGIYANGIVESMQNQGADIALNPEASAHVLRVMVHEGDVVHAGQPLLQLDDSIQHATAAQLTAQADAAESLLAELRAQPRPETLAVAAAQVDNAAAALKNAADSRAKQEHAFQIDARSISRDVLDNSRNAEAMATTALKVTQRNFALIRAGAWRYDVVNQQHQWDAASRARDAAQSTLDKFIIRAPIDGVVLSLNATVGSYATPQGAYDPRTQSVVPVATIGTPQARLAVRAYVDEILVQRLPRNGAISGVMTILGSSRRIALHFERVQPYISPKIALSDQRQERVDVRVLPLVFSFTPPRDMRVYPGEMVDVYIGAGKS